MELKSWGLCWIVQRGVRRRILQKRCFFSWNLLRPLQVISIGTTDSSSTPHWLMLEESRHCKIMRTFQGTLLFWRQRLQRKKVRFLGQLPAIIWNKNQSCPRAYSHQGNIDKEETEAGKVEGSYFVSQKSNLIPNELIFTIACTLVARSQTSGCKNLCGAFLGSSKTNEVPSKKNCSQYMIPLW